ncbi:MAG TPA: flavin reductase family protein [Gemmataceae bacterium]|nr:flavin reductase family protein [Gemmataceae bacterium]
MTNTAETNKGLAAALGRIASGLFVLTARQGEAETGMLASWVQQCSFDPPQISVAIKPGRDISNWLAVDAGFTLNILDDTQTDMIAHFGKGFKATETAFHGLDVEHLDQSGPVLSDALAFLECRVVARYAGGDHDLIVGRIIRGEMLSGGHPMIHIRKSGSHY